ncbi:helix-turn-helix transcriptional regulator [Nitrospirillum sp. BR 11828]|uniref:helix-turn-helix domain-containing protein n=1 Tax=Nitrospirillum sp. BR 11828 TaxID=3104325 RepID=UPI002ACACCFC|nr:helix-turn-helix transcriptional regulator [Nitrospirillum sp. BR 11828]MDZ5646377.1 helix-turn-helix transcriptional regulator [Nitrospirillum sp. BR 11828]
MTTPAQSRAARGMLDWSQEKLADAAGVSLSTIRDFEKGRRTPMPQNLSAIRTALEVVGVEFIGSGEISSHGGPGIRLKSP